VLDARGEAIIYLIDGLVYRYVLKDTLGSPIWTRDDISGPLSGEITYQQGFQGAVVQSM